MDADDRDALAADALDALAKLGTGDRSRAVLDALEAWAVAYAAGECKAPTPCKVRLAMRNEYIRRAGCTIKAGSPWDRACKLAKKVRDFEKQWQSSWQHFSRVPRTADTVDALLWQARQHEHDRLPRSKWTLFRLL